MIEGPNVYLLTPVSEQAKRRVKLNVPCERWQLSGDSVGIEARHIQGILDGMNAAGFRKHLDYVVDP